MSAAHKIEPSALRDKPEVLSTDDLCDVLRISPREVRAEVNSGRLGRLAYSEKDIKVWGAEVRRYLREQTELGRAAAQSADHPAAEQGGREEAAS